MRYWRGPRHQPESPGGRTGRHRRSKRTPGQAPEKPYSSSTQADGKGWRLRRRQPRDRDGRFVGRSGDGVTVVDTALDAVEVDGEFDAAPADAPTTGYSWGDFEISDELPRTAPRTPDSPDLFDGRRHCGELEDILFRQWDESDGSPSADVVRAIESLAELPQGLKERLAAGLDAIYVGPGGVPELDDMDYLRGHPLPSGQAAWDICAGAYGDRKIVVGDRPSPTPDVMMHEVGHALDDIDGWSGTDHGQHPVRQWQSDSVEFRALYDRCLPHLASDFHLQQHVLGRREFFADAFAAIASKQRPALVDMLGGDIRAALDVMLFFNRRYGI
jgi:hypothetical protein